MEPSRPATVLVTGPGGFIGRALCRRLRADGEWRVRAAVRERLGPGLADETVTIGEIGPETEWSRALEGVDAVVHLAGRAHVMNDSGPAGVAAYQRVNVAGTGQLAEAAAGRVRRFVFVSSAKVNGETSGGRPLRGDDPPARQDPYARSKAETEALLGRLGKDRALDVVTVRPPLVYGPHVRANFLSLLHAAAGGLPLPLGAVRNRRSLVYVENLVDLIVTCMRHPAPAGRTILASDGEDISTADLLRILRAELGRRPRLVPVPAPLLWAGCAMVGRTGVARRLLGDFRIDHREAQEKLGWRAPIATREGLRRTAAWFADTARGDPVAPDARYSRSCS